MTLASPSLGRDEGVRFALQPLADAALRLAIEPEWAPTVVLLGESKSGKSTLINRLVGRAAVTVDAVDPTATLARVCVCSYGAEPTRHVPTVELVDTPPVQSESELATMLASVGSADAALWCVPAFHGHTADVRACWGSLPPELLKNGAVVVTSTDRVSSEDLGRILGRVGPAAQAAGFGRVVGVSAGWDPHGHPGPEVAIALASLAEDSWARRMAARRNEIEGLREAVLAALVERPGRTGPIAASAAWSSPNAPLETWEDGQSARFHAALRSGRMAIRALLKRGWWLALGWVMPCPAASRRALLQLRGDDRELLARQCVDRRPSVERRPGRHGVSNRNSLGRTTDAPANSPSTRRSSSPVTSTCAEASRTSART